MRKKYKLELLKRIGSTQKLKLVTGFAGFGAVGLITTMYIVEKLRMERIGYIFPPHIPEFTSYEDYGLSLPHEIFYLCNNNLLVLLNRVNPYSPYIDSYVDTVIELINKLGVDEVILVGGLDSRFREGEEEYRWLRTAHSKRELKAPLFVKGSYIVGPLAALLIAFEINHIPAIAIFPYTEPEKVDHKAAAIAVKVISEILNISIPVEDLIMRAKEIEMMEQKIAQILSRERRGSVMHM